MAYFFIQSSSAPPTLHGRKGYDDGLAIARTAPPRRHRAARTPSASADRAAAPVSGRHVSLRRPAEADRPTVLQPDGAGLYRATDERLRPHRLTVVAAVDTPRYPAPRAVRRADCFVRGVGGTGRASWLADQGRSVGWPRPEPDPLSHGDLDRASVFPRCRPALRHGLAHRTTGRP